ncbi:MAG: hydrogenase nickel incorporation protein HypB [Candidatus Heimdallarchaeota archaeon]
MKNVIRVGEGKSIDVTLSENLLKLNVEMASENRDLLRKHGIRTIDVMGSIGSGKTSLVAEMVKRLKKGYRLAFIAGDLSTTIDSDRIEEHGVDVIQINTGKMCHLDANLVKKALELLDLNSIDLLFIENVGNLICPAGFQLGSDQRIVIVSVTEGPYMVIKHPISFIDANVVVINKIDLAEAMDIDIIELERDALNINPNLKVVRTNCRSGEGVAKVIEALGL